MLDINFIRQNPALVKEGITKKNIDPKLIDRFLRLDNDWRSKISILNQLKAEQNTVSTELSKTPRQDLISKAQLLKKRIANLEEECVELEQKRDEILYSLPNLPFDDVLVGKNNSENKTIREVGRKTKFLFQPKDYLTLAESLDLIDIKRAAKVSGARFGYLKNEAVLLELALINLAFKTLIKEGFIPVVPPVLIKSEMMKAMGFLDHREDKVETYFLDKDDLYFVGTSEQAIGPYHAGEIFQEEELPKRYVGFSTCFRREAGSYGKDTRGIFRVHQFDKIEMFSFCHPDNSREEHQFILSLEEKLMKALKIPYRVVEICTGDLGNIAAARFDIEAWLPSQNQYRETHSTSNATDFQARRLKIKYQPKDKKEKPAYVHALNGTAFAIGRTIIAIIENYQTERGTVKVPEVLKDYVGKSEISLRK